jgi:hypothetical protein
MYIQRFYINHLNIYFNLTYSFSCSFHGNRFCNIMLQHPQYNTIDNTIDHYLNIYFNLTYSFLCSFHGNRFCNIMLQHPQYNTIDNTIDHYDKRSFKSIRSYVCVHDVVAVLGCEEVVVVVVFISSIPAQKYE